MVAEQLQTAKTLMIAADVGIGSTIAMSQYWIMLLPVVDSVLKELTLFAGLVLVILRIWFLLRKSNEKDDNDVR